MRLRALKGEPMNRPNVYITRMIPQEGIDLLKESARVDINPYDRALEREELLEALRDRDGVICLLTDKIDASVMDAARGIKGFANYAVGFDNIDLKEATRRGIPVANTPDVLTDSTAEMAWALLFSVSRRVVESDRVMRSGTWEGWGPLQFIGGDVSGATLGIVGAGRIGTAMALKSRGFNMRIFYADTVSNPVMDHELGASRVSFEELLEESDFISIHVPLLPETRHLFGRDEFRRMKSTAYLINTARGPIIHEAELIDALKDGFIAGAGLDVYEFEPEMARGLAGLDNVVCTAHTASATRSSRTSMARKAAVNLLAMIKGERAPDCINNEVYGR